MVEYGELSCIKMHMFLQKTIYKHTLYGIIKLVDKI